MRPPEHRQWYLVTMGGSRCRPRVDVLPSGSSNPRLAGNSAGGEVGCTRFTAAVVYQQTERTGAAPTLPVHRFSNDIFACWNIDGGGGAGVGFIVFAASAGSVRYDEPYASEVKPLSTERAALVPNDAGPPSLRSAARCSCHVSPVPEPPLHRWRLSAPEEEALGRGTAGLQRMVR